MLVLKIVANLSARCEFIPCGKILKAVIHIKSLQIKLFAGIRCLFIFHGGKKIHRHFDARFLSVKSEIMNKTLSVAPAFLDLDPTSQVDVTLEKLFHVLSRSC